MLWFRLRNVVFEKLLRFLKLLLKFVFNRSLNLEFLLRIFIERFKFFSGGEILVYKLLFINLVIGLSFLF